MVMDFDVRLLAPIATSIGICVTVTLWVLNQRRKSLSFEILKREALVSVKGAARNSLEVRFDGEPVEDAYLLVVKVLNSGHLPIMPGDYQGRVSIDVSQVSEILSASITESLPADLEERLPTSPQGPNGVIQEVQKHRLLLRPLLMNGGDWIAVQLLVRRLSGNVTVRGHINGIKEITVMRRRALMPVVLTQVGAFVMACSMLLVDPRDLVPLKIEDILPYLLFFLLGYTFLSAGTYMPRLQGNAQGPNPSG
jgi:hypothetical protein